MAAYDKINAINEKIKISTDAKLESDKIDFRLKKLKTYNGQSN